MVFEFRFCGETFESVYNRFSTAFLCTVPEASNRKCHPQMCDPLPPISVAGRIRITLIVWLLTTQAGLPENDWTGYFSQSCCSKLFRAVALVIPYIFFSAPSVSKLHVHAPKLQCPVPLQCTTMGHSD